MSRRKIYLISLVIAPLLLILTLISLPSLTRDSAQATPLQVVQILPQLEGPYKRVSDVTDIPVLLPTDIPEHDDFWVTPGPFDAQKYEFYIDRTRECDGAGACTSGTFGGELITEETETLDARYAFLDRPTSRPIPRSDEPKAILTLATNIRGRFFPWIAPAQCSEARIYWQAEEEGIQYRYFVGLKCGSMADLTVFANSIINNTGSGEI